jgi:Uma2 family endonuclease
MTVEMFLSWEQRQEGRHELVAGRPYAMSGGSERHGLMAAYLLERVAPAARRAGCRPFGDGRMLRIGRDFFYPNVMVVCGRPGHDLYETDAAWSSRCFPQPPGRPTGVRSPAGIRSRRPSSNTYRWSRT